MKNNQKQEARILRAAGKSIKYIAKNLQVSVGSVSAWVRDIELTKEQVNMLSNNNPIYNQQNLGAKSRKDKASILRKHYQDEGRIMAKTDNQLHAIGCMLYWAEGAKSRTKCSFTNSDVNMMKLFIKFIREIFFVPNDKIIIMVNCYINNGLSIDDIENYWLQELQLQKLSVRKHTINIKPISSQGKKKNLLPYGVCTIRIYDTKIVQHIYGAIQEYGMFSNNYNLD